MQAAGDLHDAIEEAGLAVAEQLSRDAVDLGTADTVLYTYSFFANGLVLLFLCLRELSVARFLLRLMSRRMLWLVSLVTGVFPYMTAGRKRPIFLVGQLLIMFLARHRLTQYLDLLRAFIGDDRILDRMSFLLAAVVFFLPLLVFGPSDGPFSTIDDEFQSRTGC